MILFTALVPPEDVVDDLLGELGDPSGLGEEGFRWSSPENWHVTLAYYGEDDPETRIKWLADRIPGRQAFDVRLEAAGTFPGVLWLDVVGEDVPPLARAVGSDAEQRSYRPHLTLARFPRHRTDLAETWTGRLAGYTSRSWKAGEVRLLGSVHEAGRTTYPFIAAFELNRA